MHGPHQVAHACQRWACAYREVINLGLETREGVGGLAAICEEGMFVVLVMLL